jgi:hypothetical protein
LIPLCAAIWEGDEEFAANATILYDPSISQLLHIESIMGSACALQKNSSETGILSEYAFDGRFFAEAFFLLFRP